MMMVTLKFEVAHKAPCDVLGFDTDLSQQGRLPFQREATGA